MATFTLSETFNLWAKDGTNVHIVLFIYIVYS